ncbi:MAG TPA: PilN domain-containing protein [Stellaceae bacterium]
MAVAAAWRWWIGELAACVPSALRQHLARSRGRLLLLVDAAGDNLIEETGDGRRPLGHIDIDAAGGRQIVAHLPRARQRGLRPITLRLDARHALRTTASLPLAAERNLAQVIGFEFERLVPFKQSDVHAAYRVTARDKAAQTIAVEMTIVPRAGLAGVIAALPPLGFQPAAIQVAGTGTDAPATIALANEDRGTSSRTGHRVNLGLGIVAVSLAAACLAIPLWQGRATINSLDTQIADARRQAEASAALQKQIDAESQDQRFLVDRKIASPTVTELLATLTQLLPDDTYLTELQVKGDLVRMVGLTGSATALLGAIAKSPSFRDASFESSITRDAKTDRERFEIGAHLAGQNKP